MKFLCNLNIEYATDVFLFIFRKKLYYYYTSYYMICIWWIKTEEDNIGSIGSILFSLHLFTDGYKPFSHFSVCCCIFILYSSYTYHIVYDMVEHVIWYMICIWYHIVYDMVGHVIWYMICIWYSTTALPYPIESIWYSLGFINSLMDRSLSHIFQSVAVCMHNGYRYCTTFYNKRNI